MDSYFWYSLVFKRKRNSDNNNNKFKNKDARNLSL